MGNKEILIDKIKDEAKKWVNSNNPSRMRFTGYLSKKLKHNYTYLANIFSVTEGVTIEHYIIALKIERVKTLLKSKDQIGIYGTQGAAGSNTHPGTRQNATMAFDGLGTLWLFGGYGYDAIGAEGYQNDLWNYDTTQNKWTWVSGSKTIGQITVYGTEDMPNVVNHPGASDYGGFSWLDDTGKFWVLMPSSYYNAGTESNEIWTFSNNNSIVPLTWLSFTAVVKQNNVLLSWATANESNTDYFEIERSVDGKNFITIGTQKANNLYSLQNDYSFLDTSAAEANSIFLYYRLKQTDKDSRVSYSNIIPVNFRKEQSIITVYPNPVQNKIINLQFINKPTGIYTIHLLNTAGQMLFNKQFFHNQNSNLESIELDKKIVNAIYFLEIAEPGNINRSIKVIISKTD